MLPILSGDAGRGANDGGAAMFGMIVTPVIWAALTVAFGCAILLGAFDWLTTSRGGQFALLMAALLALGAVTFLGIAGWREHPSQLPWAMRPLLHWSLFVFP